MTKSRKVVLSLALIAIGMMPFVGVTMESNDFVPFISLVIWLLACICALCLIPALEDGHLYRILSLCTYAVLLLLIAGGMSKSKMFIYICIFISLYLPAFAMFMRREIEHQHIVLLFCVSIGLSVPFIWLAGDLLNLFTPTGLSLEIPNKATHILLSVPAAFTFLALWLFFRIRKIQCAYPTLLVASFWLPISVMLFDRIVPGS